MAASADSNAAPRFVYDPFISYGHRLDRSLAISLERSLDSLLGRLAAGSSSGVKRRGAPVTQAETGGVLRRLRETFVPRSVAS